MNAWRAILTVSGVWASGRRMAGDRTLGASALMRRAAWILAWVLRGRPRGGFVFTVSGGLLSMDDVLRREFEHAADAFFKGEAGRVTKVWVDYLGDAPYVRACIPDLDGEGDDDKAAALLDRLVMLRDYMRRISGRRWVAIAYARDLSWVEVERISARLRDRAHGGTR